MRSISIIFYGATLVLLSCRVNRVTSEQIQTNTKVFSRALNGIIESYFAMKHRVFGFYVFDPDSTCEQFSYDMISMYSREFPTNSCPVVLYVKRNFNDKWRFNVGSSSIIFIKSEHQLTAVIDYFHIKAFDQRRLHHLIILCEPPKNKPTLLNMNLSFSNILHYSSILFQEPSTLNIKFFMTNSLSYCKKDQSTFLLHNEYVAEKQKWKHVKFNLRKLTDYQQCIFLVNFYTGFRVTAHIDGFESTIIQLGAKLNFKVMLRHSPEDQSFTDVKMAIDYPKDAESFDIFVFLHRNVAYVYSTGEAYNSYEKLLLPFDMETWISLGGTFMIGFWSIFIIITTRHIGWQRFIFGLSVRTPAFNMIIAFFGQGQNILPGRNFARYLLMMFILFCLIIRTGYQSVQFELLFKV